MRRSVFTSLAAIFGLAASIAASVLVFLPLEVMAGSGHLAEGGAYPGPTRVNGTGLLIVKDHARPGTVENGGGYDPSAVYPGVYEAARLYKKSPDATLWTGSRKPASLERVTCPDAKNSLGMYGSWKGHLNIDGSCGPAAEPLEWVTGNRLNYDAAVAESGDN